MFFFFFKKKTTSFFSSFFTSDTHLEIVTYYTAAYRRFASRWDFRYILFSVCGTYFAGANITLKHFFKELNEMSKLFHLLANNDKNWVIKFQTLLQGRIKGCLYSLTTVQMEYSKLLELQTLDKICNEPLVKSY